MYVAMIATRFAGTGTQADPFRPKWSDDYPGVSWVDVVGIPAGRLGTLAKNIYIVWVTVPDAVVATLNAATADVNYRVLYQSHFDDVTGVEDTGNRTSILTAPQLSNIKSFLQTRGYVAGDLAGISLPITREDATSALVNLFRSAT